MSFRESTSNWQWRYFAAPQIPDVLDTLDGFIDDELALPDGRKVPAVPFELPVEGIVNMYDIIAETPEVSARTIITADFYAPEAGSLFVGFGADWKWTLRLNGKLLLSALISANSEAPVSSKNHSQEIKYVAGRNQIILEVFGGTFRHKGIDGGMDVAFQIIEKASELKIVYQPFVSYPDSSENAVSVIFSASRKSPAAVDYRLAGSNGWQRVYDNLGGQMRHDRMVHSIRIEGLQAASTYEYKVILLDDFRALEESESAVHLFHTAAPAGASFTFSASADLQDPASRTDYLEKLLGENAPFNSDFFAFIGDLYWTTDYDRSVMDEFIVPFTEIAGEKMPLVMVRGNHEIYGKESNRFFEYFTPPYPGREGYYMFKWGDVCFIVLDFCDDAPNVPPPSTRQFHDFDPYLAAEAKWLARAVNDPICRDAKYRIVMAHGVPVGDVCSYMPGNVRKVIDPVFGGSDPAVKIHLWLGGHIHRPLRSIPGKKAFRSMLPPEEFGNGKLGEEGERFHFPVVITGGPTTKLGANMQFTGFKVDVTPEKIIVSSIDRYNAEFDRIAIALDGSVEEIYSAPEFRYYEY